MTRNIYFGADIRPSLDDPIDGPAIVFAEFLSTNFAGRVIALADEIEEKMPDLIGFQEAFIFNYGNGLIIDAVESILEELSKRGVDYSIAVSNENQKSPSSDLGVLIDRDAIVVNNQRESLKIMRTDTAFFNNIAFTRGWVSVDAKLDGKHFRFANTHLEVSSPFSPELDTLNLVQAAEFLKEVLKSTAMAVIAVGDMNTLPTSNTYATFIKEMDDVWDVNEPDDGFTCCQPSGLDAADSANYLRIDYIFYSEASGLKINVKSAKLVGDKPFQELQPFFSSDHAGVVSKLVLKK
jgi:endonuclease/exonuclease/phosphatase family metal-dependent hydrolase